MRTKHGAYYNENEPFAAQWLRNLIAADLIASGDVDERSIEEVKAEDLKGYTQCHFFGGIGIWSYALRRAGWADSTPVWTGSCPCQSFSASGKREGFSDKRHLWPAWFRLIREHHPVAIFGEQVASKDGLAWFDVVSADLEGEGYAIGAADFCAASVGAPHRRQRLYFVADTTVSRRKGTREHGSRPSPLSARSEQCLELDNLADSESRRCRERRNEAQQGSSGYADSGSELGNSSRERLEIGQRPEDGRGAIRDEGEAASEPSLTNGFWEDAEWIYCQDGKYRPTKPCLFPLAPGTPGRVGKLRAAGNSLVAPQAEEFIRAYLEIR